MQSGGIFARLAAMFGIHCSIFTEPLILLGGTHFENHCTKVTTSKCTKVTFSMKIKIQNFDKTTADSTRDYVQQSYQAVKHQNLGF